MKEKKNAQRQNSNVSVKTTNSEDSKRCCCCGIRGSSVELRESRKLNVRASYRDSSLPATFLYTVWF